MLSDSRFRRGGVSARMLGLSLFAALVVIAGCASSNTVTIGPPAKLAITTQPSSASAGSSTITVTVSVEDASGHVVPTATNQVTIAIGTNPSAGTLSGTATATAVAGVATFSGLGINNAGSGYTLSASATGLTSATSNAFNVVGPATKLAVTVQPSNVAAGISIAPAVTVSVEDAAGNVVPTATNQITIALGTNPSSGILSGTAQANAVAGVATFSSLSINKTGTGYTLAASATGLTSATSSTFNVTAGAAAKLVFSAQPTNTTAGSPISPAVTVTVEDSQGNVVTSAPNVVTMGSGSTTITGTTAVAAVNGVATFSNLNINAAGAGYTLSATATGLTSATSNAFNVLVGAAAKLVFVTEPSNVAAGSSINPAVVVNVEDVAGNVVPTATNQITIAIGTNPSSGTLSGTGQANAVAGVATFSTLSINKVGTGYTLTNSASGLAGTTSTAFNVTAGAATKLAFTVEPTNVTAGAAISPAVVVSVEDSQGNVVTTATNQITMAIGTNPSTGLLSGTAQVNAVAGVATFSTLNINNAGTGYTFGASATGLTAATSGAFNVLVGAASKLVITTQPTNVAAGSAITPAVQISVEDNQGNLVTTATNQITVAIGTNPASGVLSGTAQVNAVAGIATFSTLSINKTGTGYTLTASATSLAGATSSAFNVSAGTAAKLVFTAEPVNTVAATSIAPSVQVSVEDALGNVVTGATNQITIAIGTNPASGSLTGTVTTNAVAGVATFSTLDINNVGTGYTLTASATGLTAATSTAFNIIVSIGPPAKLAFTVQPSNVASGNSIAPSVQVSVEDAQGNVVPSATNQITIAIGTNPSSGVLSGTMQVNAVSGVATFSNLGVSKSGIGYTLTAGATSLTGATSGTFNVTAGTASKLAFTVQPSNVAAGSSIAPAVQVTIEDAQSNVVTTATNQITIAIGTNPSTGTLSGTAQVNAVAGVATFSTLSINRTGTGYTLGASATALTSATSSAFNVTAGTATTLAFTVQPTNAAAGSAIAPAVQVSIEDGQGNVVTTATNQITIAIGTNPASGTLSGTAQVNAVAGVATFSTLAINNLGTGYTLSASATGLTGATSGAFNVVSGCTTNCTISGTVSGAWASGVTITLSGGPSTPSPVTTDSNGNYSFASLSTGTYTVTPSLNGYTYSPAAPSITTAGPTTTQNFTATSVISSFSISGTISYAGAKTGNTIIRVFPGGCSNCSSVGGSSFATVPSVSGTAYIIRGLQSNGGSGNGSYIVTAEIDTIGTGIPNESNPAGSSSTVSIASSNATGVNFSVADRVASTPVTPTHISVAAGNGSAVVQYQDPEDSNGEEIAQSYNVYFGPTSTTNATGSPKNFKAQGQGTDLFILTGIPNGTTFFEVTAVNGNGESAKSTPVSAVVAAGTGANTVSGTVTFPGSATGHTMYVGAYGDNGIFFEPIVNPVSPQAYSFSGVPSGTYQNFAIVDMNNDGEINPPDVTDVTNHSNPPTITVAGNTTGNITLTAVNSTIGVPTSVQGFISQPNSYGLGIQVDDGTKLPISMTLFSGKNVSVPYDMNADSHNANYNPIFTNTVSPTVGDQYQLLVTFSDGSTQVVTATVTAVITSFAQNLAMQTTTPGSPTVPLLTWTAPATPPTALPYTYSVSLFNGSGTSQEFWNYYGSGSGNGLPSSQLNVLFDTDGSANPSSSLTVGGTYNWTVFVQDNNNNSGAFTVTYVVP